MTVGDKIRAARKNRGFTQKQLGDLCGINEANIRKYELGNQNPKIETISKIAAALNVPISDLTNWAEMDEQFNEKGKLAADVANLDAFITYLRNVGYVVKIDPYEAESHIEEMTHEGEVVGQSIVRDAETYSATLIKEGKETTFTEAEFGEFEKKIKDSVDYQVWMKNNDK